MKKDYGKWVQKIIKRLENAGYVVNRWYSDGIITMLTVQNDAPEVTTPEIDIADVFSMIDDLIERKYLEPHWISENGEIYVRVLRAFLGA